ncbi:hypothetical protein HYX02_01610 [Candidatus Woesearchaeota archaeon]|nr:hypothetical protein [Candidatus Woesearchaeota archaeon]
MIPSYPTASCYYKVVIMTHAMGSYAPLMRINTLFLNLSLGEILVYFIDKLYKVYAMNDRSDNFLPSSTRAFGSKYRKINLENVVQRLRKVGFREIKKHIMD